MPMIGTVLHGRWRIVRELGRGGMGEVYLAEHVELHRREALKILMPSLAADPQFVTRFRREARAVNRLRHPNIIALYDFGQLADGRFYLAMEYADGESVSKLLRRGRAFDVPRALHVLAQLAYAVHHAHSRGVVHRDLKPGNLIVAPDDTLKVLDFGMAKIVAPDHAETAPVSSADNAIWGTARYMAPERIMGVGDDPRSDLYSIGCVAHEIVVGGPPFEGSSNEIIEAHLSREPEPPSAWRRDVAIPPQLDAVILRCLAKQADARFQTAAELYAALCNVPGYPRLRSEPRRRYIPIERAHGELDAATNPPDAHGDVRGALRTLAEALLDAGAGDPRLVSGIAALRDHEQSLARLEAAQDALEHEAAALRQTNGDRARSFDDGIASVRGLRAGCLDKLVAAYEQLERVVDELLPAHVAHPTVVPLVQRLAVVKRMRPPGQR
jgi:serine/threonine-protein kinase